MQHDIRELLPTPRVGNKSYSYKFNFFLARIFQELTFLQDSCKILQDYFLEEKNWLEKRTKKKRSVEAERALSRKGPPSMPHWNKTNYKLHVYIFIIVSPVQKTERKRQQFWKKSVLLFGGRWNKVLKFFVEKTQEIITMFSSKHKKRK